MPRFPERAVYPATFGSMTAAAIVVIALIILGGDTGDPDGDGSATGRAVVAEQNIAAGTTISKEMVKVIELPEELLVPGAYRDSAPVIGDVTKVAIAEGDQITASKVGPSIVDFGSRSYYVPPGQRHLPVVVPSPSPSFR